MHKGARTDLSRGREVTRVPTATRRRLIHTTQDFGQFGYLKRCADRQICEPHMRNPESRVLQGEIAPVQKKPLRHSIFRYLEAILWTWVTDEKMVR
jgi:hypothetical protein